MLRRAIRLTLYTVFIAFSWWGGLELYLRQPTTQMHLPPQTFSAEYAPINLKYYLLDQYIAEHGQLDCLIIGSSIALNGIDPEVVSAAYQAETGEELNCFNFALVGSFMQTSHWLVEDLVTTYQPRLIVWGLTALNLDNSPISPEFLPFWNSPWLRYQRGEVTVKGWLYEHSTTARYLETLRLQWLGGNATVIEAGSLYTASGYRPLVRYKYDPFIALPPPTEIRAFQLLPDFLDILANLKKLETPLLFVELPVLDPSMPVLYQNQVIPYQVLFENMTQDMAGLPFWRTDHLTFFTPVDWADELHFYFTGSVKFSDWLGRQFAATRIFDHLSQIPEGQVIPDPQITLSMAETVPQTITQYQVWAEAHPAQVVLVEAIILNPALPPPTTQLQVDLLALALAWQFPHTAIPEAHLVLWQILAQAQFESDLTLTPQQTASLQQWRETKQADLLGEAGIPYLLVSSRWMSFLSEAEREKMLSDKGYQLLATWDYAAQDGLKFYLYEIVTPEG